jgi:hypothetical protein
MAITVNDLHDLIRLLEEHPEWRAEMRRVLLTDELLELPRLVRELIEAIQRTDAQLAELIAINRQHTQLLAEHSQQLTLHSQQLSDLAEIGRQHSQLLVEHSQLLAQQSQLLTGHSQQLTLHSQQLSDLAEIGRQHTQLLAEHSQQLTLHSQQLSDLAEIGRQHSQLLAEHSQQLAQHSQEMALLREAQERTEQTVERIEQTVQDLAAWRRGEMGRRKGEQYEQRIIRRARSLFTGGDGGSPEKPDVARRLAQWLKPLYQSGRALSEEEDPYLADLIWWKGNEVLVIEVSHKIDRNDVRRAAQRAHTLRSVGVDATAVVIGEQWASARTQTIAQQEGVEWMISNSLSGRVARFRQRPDDEPALPPTERGEWQ